MPTGIGTALAIAGVAGAGASVYGAKKAANTQKDAAQASNDLIRPYVNAGNESTNRLMKLLGLGGFDEQYYLAQNPDVAAAVKAGQFASGQEHYNQYGKKEGRPGYEPVQSALEQTPGYQFARTQGLKAVQNSASAKGLGSSGAALKGAADFATGLADKTYGEQYNRLLGLTQVGQNAAVGAGSNLVGAANAQGAAYVNAGNNVAQGFNAATQGYLTNKLIDGIYSRTPAV